MNRKMRDLPAPQGLYDPAFEHDACGIYMTRRLNMTPAVSGLL